VQLLEADRQSFYASCMKCAQDGLLPDGKQAVLKIYNSKQADNTWAKTVQYEPMTDGLLMKLRNSGEIVGAPKVHCWYEHDEFSYELGDNERIAHKPALTNRGAIKGAYSIVKLKSGDTSREVMSIEEIDLIMARTKSKDKDGNIFGPWKTDKPEMCRKTVFKRHVQTPAALDRSRQRDQLRQRAQRRRSTSRSSRSRQRRRSRSSSSAVLPPSLRSPSTAARRCRPARSEGAEKVVEGEVVEASGKSRGAQWPA
jgi:recombination protein RecT